MQKYRYSVINQANDLRSAGKTYREIRQAIGIEVPNSTLSHWFKNISLPNNYFIKIVKMNKDNLNKARLVAIKVNKTKRQKFLNELDEINLPIAHQIHNAEAAKIALSMLCLGEASKYRSKTSSFSLGNTDPRIIVLFLSMLKLCFDFKLEKVRCTVQCRADQDIIELEKYWVNVTKIPKKLFYKAQVDPRTIGKPTKNKEYKGVLRVDYFDTRVQLELESLANLIYNQLRNYNGPEV